MRKLPGPNAYLSRLGELGPVAAYPITPGEWLIGRNPNRCQVVVPDEFRAAGRLHARVTCDEDGECWVEGLHSNGTFVNDEALTAAGPQLLTVDDIITLAGPRNSKPTRCTYQWTRRPMELPRVPSTDARTLLLSENATILLLMSNPSGTQPLRLDEEVRAIDEAINSAKNRDQLDLRQAVALRISGLQSAVLRHTPTVVHFSGHGSPESCILLADEYGTARPVPAEALSNFFQVMSPPIRCVVLNACYTQIQAEAIAEHVDCVIGMSREISDPAAVFFSEGFYRALAYGLPISKSFELGRSAIQLCSSDEHAVPLLLAGRGVAEDLCLTF